MLETVSLFSGCGGLDLGFIKAGFNIIWANDYDKFAVQTYKEKIGNHMVGPKDIRKIDKSEIPDHKLLIAGFPCQPFSMMGKEKGFDDERGTYFFQIEEILQKKDTEIIVLENVRTLKTHNSGKTFDKMKNILRDKLNYHITYKVLNSADYGVPQNRRRVFVIGFKDEKLLENFEWPKKVKLNKTLQDILEKNVDDKYFLSEKIKKTILATGTKNYYAEPETDLEVARPLCATMHKMHRASQDNYVTQKGKLRRLTPAECSRLQGFPENFEDPVVSDTQAYRQFGNAVTVNVSHKIASQIRRSIEKTKSEVKCFDQEAGVV
ncbi:MAG: DNA cytosine methyltransferase [Candidatus Woesearchaeota archaeon]